jgi:predicted nucleic acid-binding protein
MQVLVDTSVWSLVLRRSGRTALKDRDAQLAQTLQELIREGRVVMLGVIRQELLSGIRNAQQCAKVREALAAFDDVAISSADHERAAELFNLCRGKGIQGSDTDFLICAVAERQGWPIMTSDGDFANFARLLKLELI